MDEIVEIVRRIGRQQGRNAYYRTCYTLLKKSQDLILQTSNELLDLYHSNAFEEPESVSTIADDLRDDIHAMIARERRARSHWDEVLESDK
jgi:chorismate mutase